MLSFDSSLSNTVDDGDDDDDADDDLSRFLLGLNTSRAAPGGSWLLDFYNMQEKTAVQFYSPRNHRGWCKAANITKRIRERLHN